MNFAACTTRFRFKLFQDETRVQGIDYYYTLQGFLKGINGLEEPNDPGLDGTITGRDVYGFNLNYFENDYASINSSANPEPVSTSSGFNDSAMNLFNGNIRSMVQWLNQLNNHTPEGYVYHYDQLNRITRMNVWQNYDSATYQWGTGGTAVSDYHEEVTFGEVNRK